MITGKILFTLIYTICSHGPAVTCNENDVQEYRETDLSALVCYQESVAMMSQKDVVYTACAPQPKKGSAK